MMQVGGRFPLEARIASGDLWGMKLIHSPFVRKDIVTAVDAASFWHVSDAPEIDVSATASLAMASASCADPAIKAGGTAQDAVDSAGSIHESDAVGTTLATKVRSMFHANITAVKVVQPMSWTVMPGSVAYITDVARG